VKKLNETLEKKETENVKLAADKEKLESYTKKALHNVQNKVCGAVMRNISALEHVFLKE
jgi:hypothetical protein